MLVNKAWKLYALHIDGGIILWHKKLEFELEEFLGSKLLTLVDPGRIDHVLVVSVLVLLKLNLELCRHFILSPFWNNTFQNCWTCAMY